MHKNRITDLLDDEVVFELQDWIAERAQYDLYGQIPSTSPNADESASGEPWIFRCQGRRRDDSHENALDGRVRDFNSALGRWLERDPAGYADGLGRFLFPNPSDD